MSLISRVWDAQKNEWVAFQPEKHQYDASDNLKVLPPKEW